MFLLILKICLLSHYFSTLLHAAGGHRNAEEEREKIRSAQLVALERAQMAAKRYTHPLIDLEIYLSIVYDNTKGEY